MTSATDKVEAAAKAIWLVFSGRVARGADESGWLRIPSVQRDRYREEARAALKAAGVLI